MKSQTLKRRLAYSLLLVASFTLLAASTNSQERKVQPVDGLQPVVQGDCPRPITLTLTAQNPTSFDPADFSQGQLSAPHMSGLGDTLSDKNFLYTFKWNRDSKCCQITRAVLTVKMRANQPGQSKTSPDAGNDGITIMYLKNVVAPHNEPVYSTPPVWPFTVGQPASKTWVLSPAALSNINASGRLSFAVQDDTGVVSATLQLWGCCLTTPRTEAVEQSSIIGSTK